MAYKFMIFVNEDEEPTITLAYVDYHKQIEAPDGYTCRAGGGYWNLKNKTLRLYDLSEDFGKYDKKLAKEAYNNKDITIDGEIVFDELGIKELTLE